jgi:response regulator of citrate/malate metabolism
MAIRFLHDGIPYTRLRTLKSIVANANFSQQETASWVGISQTTMSRTLEEMSMLKIIKMDKVWTIVDPILIKALKS